MIEGAVITFVDNTEMIQVWASLMESETVRRLAVVLREVQDAITVQDLSGHILTWNPSAERIYGWSEAEAIRITIHGMTPEDLSAESLLVFKCLFKNDVVEPYRMKHLAIDDWILEV